MKDIIRLPVLFIFVFLLLFLLFLALSVLTLWGSVASEGREAALLIVEASIPQVLLQVLPPAVLLSLFILLVRISVKPNSRILSLIIPLAAAFVLLAFGYQVLGGFAPTEAAAVIEPTPHRYLVPGVFNSTESKVFFIEDLDERILSSVVIAEGGGSDRRLRYFPQGRVEAGRDLLTLSMAGYTLEADPDPVYGGMFAADPVLKGFFRDIGFLNRELQRMFRHSLTAFYFTVLALVIAFYGSGLFLRLSRWHLLNVALALLVLRGFLAVFRFMSEGVEQVLQFLPELSLLLVGGLLLLLDILFVPFRRWQEE